MCQDLHQKYSFIGCHSNNNYIKYNLFEDLVREMPRGILSMPKLFLMISETFSYDFQNFEKTIVSTLVSGI